MIVLKRLLIGLTLLPTEYVAASLSANFSSDIFANEFNQIPGNNTRFLIGYVKYLNILTLAYISEEHKFSI